VAQGRYEQGCARSGVGYGEGGRGKGSVLVLGSSQMVSSAESKSIVVLLVLVVRKRPFFFAFTHHSHSAGPRCLLSFSLSTSSAAQRALVFLFYALVVARQVRHIRALAPSHHYLPSCTRTVLRYAFQTRYFSAPPSKCEALRACFPSHRPGDPSHVLPYTRIRAVLERQTEGSPFSSINAV
jgi:hypothetical protein